MGCLQQLVVKQQCEAYVLTSRYCTDCQTFQRIKDYGKRKIRTVYGGVEVGNPRIMNCRRCLPYFCDASAVLRDICPDQATPELMELSARMGGCRAVLNGGLLQSRCKLSLRIGIIRARIRSTLARSYMARLKAAKTLG